MKPEKKQEKKPDGAEIRPEMEAGKKPEKPENRPERKPRAKSISYFFRILAHFKPHIPGLFVIFLTYLGMSACNVAYPYLNGTILYDQVLGNSEALLARLGLAQGQLFIALALVVVGMVVVKLVYAVLLAIQAYVNAKIVPMIVLELENEVFRSMSELSLRFFNNQQTGGLMTRVLSDASRVISFFLDFVPWVGTELPSMLVTCAVMFTLNWKLALVSLCLMPFMVLLHALRMTKGHLLFSRRHRAERDLKGKLNDNISGVRVVKSFGQERREIERFSSANASVRSSEVDIAVNFTQIQAGYTFLEQTMTLLVWAVGAYLVLGPGELEYGHLITFAGYVTQLNPFLRMVGQASREWTDSMNAAGRVFTIVDAKPDIIESEHPVSMEDVRGEITLEHVTFGYRPKQPVLTDISLHVPAGTMLGIVGRSGAGKTTLIHLISRMYEVDEGAICVDGVNIRDFSFRDLRRNVAVVSQETYIFMGTVAQNIAYAKPGATREEIIRAAKLASAHDFICKLPDAYDTQIGASGHSLSGGERQRLSIARAILADPKILILDEATASVDTETERAIQKSLSYLAKGRTTLSIAHRLSTLRDADYLIVLDHGRIVEQGTHQELVEKNGVFAHLMELQTKTLAMRGLE